MGALKTVSFSTLFDLMRFGSVEMVLFYRAFWVSAGSLLGFFKSLFFRFRDLNNSSGTVESNVNEFVGTEVSVPDDDVNEEKEMQFFTKFQFRPYEEFVRSNVEINITSKYEVMSAEAIGVLMEEPEALSFTVNDFQADSSNGKVLEEESKAFEEESPENFEEQEFSDFDLNSNATLSDGDYENTDMDQPELGLEDIISSENEDVDFDDELSSDNFKEQELSDFDLNSNANLSGGDHENTGINPPELGLEDIISSENEDVDLDDELSSEKFQEQKLSDFDSNSNANLSDGDHENTEMDLPELGSEDSSSSEDKDDDFDDESNSGKGKDQDFEDSNGFESLWEHQELIEQLKMELKRVRATGLPTIPEESEYPRMMEDLKPWKIDEKMARQDTIGELHRFYDLYRERMRKFDVLNYQKMYAIGLLQSKDPLQSIPLTKSSIHESFKLCKPKKSKPDPMDRFVRELLGDLETVYVAQLCLSWEFVQWQYEKTLELCDSDPRGIHTYDEVAGEFQQFQVLIQRFMENEPFEGPRVQNYAKNRCVTRNFLQVPIIREDRDRGRITGDMLGEIMEESIRLFWRFLRADKDARSGMRRESQSRAQDPADESLLSEVQEDHHKKERKLKEMVRSGNCMVRRFLRKGQEVEDGSDQVLYFFSQVDMKLVGRVLNMSRISTEQLLWCHGKLGKISFVNRKISVEPSFLLFPC